MQYINTVYCTKTLHRSHAYIPEKPLASEITAKPAVAWSGSLMYKSATTALFVFSCSSYVSTVC